MYIYYMCVYYNVCILHMCIIMCIYYMCVYYNVCILHVCVL